MRIIREIILWAISVMGAGIMLMPLCYEPVSGFGIVYELVSFVIGFVICAAASQETSFGRKLSEDER